MAVATQPEVSGAGWAIRHAMGPPIPPFIYHAIFFGPPLGIYLATRLPFSARSA